MHGTGMRQGRLVLAAALTAMAMASGPAVVRAQNPAGPTVTFTAGPDGPTRDRRPTFEFVSESGATFECRMDGVTEPCLGGSFRPESALADGAHLFEARATSTAGTTGDWAARAFTVDTTGPETVFVTTPPDPTTDRTPIFEFAAPDEPGASFECSIDIRLFAACASPWTPGELSLGRHHVEVRGVDALGNADASPATVDLTIAETVTRLSPPSTVDLRSEPGVRLLGDDLALNLERVVRALRTRETPAILRRGGVAVSGITALMPGTVTIAGRAPTRSGNSVLLRGSRRFDAKGSGSLVLRLTHAGRRALRRFRAMPLLLSGRFSSASLSLSATRQAWLVRDWLTASEARRAVAAAVERRQGVRPKRLAVEVVRRCGSGCLAVEAAWLYADALWTSTARARQVDGELRARLKPPAVVPFP
jgi:hypothetical protein